MVKSQHTMSKDTYDVYLAVSLGALRNHHAIWVCTDSNEQLLNGTFVPAGILVQVTGNVQQGMEFEVKDAIDPTTSPESKRKQNIGTIRQNDLQKLIEICQSLAPPPKQFDGPKKIDPDKPLYRCQDWTAEVIQLLMKAGVLQTDVP